MLAAVDHVLRAEGQFRVGARTLPWGRLGAMILAGGALYGAMMGYYGSSLMQASYSALKVPMLLGVTSVICLPSFYALNAVLGLRDDLSDALRGILAAQAVLAVSLASLAPVTAVFYVSSRSYDLALLFNGLQFALATGLGQLVLDRHYRVLIQRNRRHVWGRRAWLLLYVFVAIQMAWVLRPFVGAPGLPPTFLREDAWSNAYMKVLAIVWNVLG